MEIYEAPKASLGESGSDNGPGIICTALSIFAAITYLAIIRVIPTFAETFQSFGADLPWLTLAVLNIYPLFLVLVVFSLSLNLVWLVKAYKPNWVEKIMKISVYNILLSIACFLVSVVSLYLPIFQLGRVL